MKPTDADRVPAFDRLVARGLADEADASGVACPDADLLAAWFDHALSAPEAGRIEAHAASCLTCQQILADLARSEPEVTRAAPLPAPARPWHWHWRWLAPLATAAVVLIVAQRTLRAPGEPPYAPIVVTAPASQAEAPAAVTETRAQADAAKPSGAAAPAQVQVDRFARTVEPSVRQAEVAGKAADAQAVVQVKDGEAAKRAQPAPAQVAEEARAEAKATGGVVGGVVGGVAPGAARGRADIAAENVAAPAVAPAAQRPAAPVPMAPLPTALRTAGAAKAEVTGGDAAPFLSSTSGVGPSGSTATWRFGQAGVIERTVDGGRTWERQRSGVSTPLADGSATTDLVCWIVGAHGVVLRSTDGRTWERLPLPTFADLVSVHAWSESAATVTAADRTEYETADGGKSWRRREPRRSLLP